MKLIVKATSWTLKKKDITAPRLPTGSLSTGLINVLGFLIAPFLMGKIRKFSLLAVGRKRTEMLCISVLGVESMFGVTMFLCYHRQTRTQSHRVICVHLHGHVWPKF